MEDNKNELELVKQELEKEKNSPVNIVEDSLASFVKSAFEVTKEDFDFGRELQESLITDLTNGELSPNQKIALYSSFAVNNNDKISKLLAPIMGLMTSRQQAEMEATARIASTQIESSNRSSTGNDLNLSMSKDVLQGMSSLQDFINIFQPKKEPPQNTQE